MRIRISNQGEPSRIESFEHKSEIRIGRVPTNDLVLAERGISSNHARLVFDHNGQLYVEDLGSTNGTMVNGQRVSAVALNPGDMIQLGTTTLTFRVDG